jgi:hypothetical protein
MLGRLRVGDIGSPSDTMGRNGDAKP